MKWIKSTSSIYRALRDEFSFGFFPVELHVLPTPCLTLRHLSDDNCEAIRINKRYPSSLRNHKSEKEVIGTNPKKLIKERLSSLSFELIFFELPPSFSTLTGSAYLASDLIILPCTPSNYALESVSLTIEAIDNLANEFEAQKKNYKILMNQYNSKRITSQQVLEALMDNFGSKVLPMQIKQTAEIENAMNAGLTIYETKTTKVVKESFNDLTISICGLEL